MRIRSLSQMAVERSWQEMLPSDLVLRENSSLLLELVP